jgi:hypothetical protein
MIIGCFCLEQRTTSLIPSARFCWECISSIIESLILKLTSWHQRQEDETISWDVLQDYFSNYSRLRWDFNSFLGELSSGIQEFEKLLYIKKKLNKAFHTVNVPELISMDMSGFICIIRPYDTEMLFLMRNQDFSYMEAYR